MENSSVPITPLTPQTPDALAQQKIQPEIVPDEKKHPRLVIGLAILLVLIGVVIAGELQYTKIKQNDLVNSYPTPSPLLTPIPTPSPVLTPFPATASPSATDDGTVNEIPNTPAP